MLKLTADEMKAAFESTPPVLGVEDLANLLRLKTRTIYEWVARQHLDGTYCKRGKFLFFWRDRVIAKLFNGP